MKKSQEKQVLKKVKKFIDNYFGKDSGITDEMQFLCGEEGTEFSDYAHKGQPYMSFDGGIYDYMNYGHDSWKFKNAFDEFCETIGVWYEQGNAWNASFYGVDE